MKNLIAAVAVASLVTTSAHAEEHREKHHGPNLGSVVAGAIIGGLVVDAMKSPHNFNRYEYQPGYSYPTPNYYNDPCSYSPPEYLVRNDPVRAEYIRGQMSRACEEQQEKMRRAYYCGYNGSC